MAKFNFDSLQKEKVKKDGKDKKGKGKKMSPFLERLGSHLAKKG